LLDHIDVTTHAGLRDRALIGPGTQPPSSVRLACGRPGRAGELPISSTSSKEINAGLADPNIKARFADLGLMALPGSPAEFGKLIAEETEKWGKVVKFAGIKAE
jgi:hypothetical protein